MANAATSREFVNLLVDLDERFGDETLNRALARVHADGFTFSDVEKVDERRLSWIDAVFDGTWSSEVALGSAVFATRGREPLPVGFAAYGASGLRFYWLRAWQNREDVGIFGPFGIVAEFKETPLGSALLTVTLGAMRRRGYRHALIPAVTEPLFDFFGKTAGARIVERISMDRIAPNLRTTVLASGNGTNFQAVIDALGDGLGLEVQALISNRSDAFALERAKRAGIPAHVHLWDRNAVARERYDAELSERVASTEPDLVLLLGWMHVLAPEFVARFPQMINIHPAFLPFDGTAESVTMLDGTVIPAFRGAHAIRDAIEARVPWYGATAHRVEAAFDRGAILKRAPLRLTETEEERALAALRATEHNVLIGAIRRILAER